MCVVNLFDACLDCKRAFQQLFGVNSDVLDSALAAFVLVEPVLVVNAAMKSTLDSSDSLELYCH